MNLGEIEKEKLAFDEEEKEIRLFESEIGNNPISLSSIDHSIVSKIADYAFVAFRLYVVLSSVDSHDILQRLREEVKNWDQ